MLTFSMMFTSIPLNAVADQAGFLDVVYEHETEILETAEPEAVVVSEAVEEAVEVQLPEESAETKEAEVPVGTEEEVSDVVTEEEPNAGEDEDPSSEETENVPAEEITVQETAETELSEEKYSEVQIIPTDIAAPVDIVGVVSDIEDVQELTEEDLLAAEAGNGAFTSAGYLTGEGIGTIRFVPVEDGNDYDVKINGEGNTVTIYCLQQTTEWPHGDLGVNYVKYSDADDSYNTENVNLLTPDQIEILKKIVFAGYPNDSQGILRKYGYSREYLGEFYPFVAGQMTNIAIWTMMTEWGKPGSNPAQTLENAPEIALELIDFATNDNSVKRPSSNVILIEGSGKMSLSDGKWSTGDLKITQPSGFNLRFDLNLPEGTYAVNSAGEIVTSVDEQEIFRIVSDNVDALTEFVVTASATASYPTDISFFVTKDYTVNKVTGQKHSDFQTMLYVEKETQSLSGTLNLTKANVGNLSVSKSVTGSGADLSQAFDFTLTVYKTVALDQVDTNINGTYGELTFADGVAHFTLTDGQKKTAQDLPAGLYYTVVEATATGYSTTALSEAGTIENGTTIDASFTNAFNTARTGSIKLEGTKSLNGNRGKNIGDGEFKFAVTDAEGNHLATGSTYAGAPGSADIDFTTIYYTSEDKPSDPASVQPNTHYGVHDGQIFEYQVTEVKGSDSHIEYDTRKIPVTITVTDNSEGGFTATPAYPNGTITFENKYKVEKAVTIEAYKHLIGRHQGINVGEFSFDIMGPDRKTGEKVKVGSGTTGECTQDPTSGNNYTSIAKIDFTNCFTYTQDDIGKTFVYEITENSNPLDTAIKEWDDHTFTITIRVEAAEDGIDVKVDTNAGDNVFTNTYQADGSLTIMGNKELTGNRPVGVKAGEFNFALYDNGTVVSKGTTCKNGHIHFTPIRFSSTAGDNESHLNDADPEKQEYVYHNIPETGKTIQLKAKELPGSDSTITYNTDVELDVTIEVEESVNGVFPVSVASVKKNGADIGGITFTNNYTATGELKLEGTKSLKGGRAAAIGDGEFTFSVKDMNNSDKVMAEGVTKAGPLAGASIVFDSIRYTTAPAPATPADHTHYNVKNGDVFRYSVTEDAVADTNIAIDDNTYFIEVTAEVKDDGTICLKTTYDNGTLVKTDVQSEGRPLTFVNEYKAKGNIKLQGTKNLTGNRTKNIADHEFEFTVTDITTGKHMATGLTFGGGSAETAKIAFYQIYYTSEETPSDPALRDPNTHYGVVDGQVFEYLVTEVKGSDSHISYDQSFKRVSVQISDDGNGKFTPTVTYPEGADCVTFVNEYKAEETITITAEKLLAGRHQGIGYGEFSFDVMKINGAAKEKVGLGYTDAYKQKPESGNGFQSIADIIFEGNFTYTQNDIGQTFVYEITENRNALSTAIKKWDEHVLTLTVTVKDKADGSGLEVETTYSGSQTFRNEYEANGSLTIMGNKELTGDRPSGIGQGEFDFELYEESTGTVVSKGTTCKNGHIHFTPIRFSSTAGDNESHLNESNPENQYYVYCGVSTPSSYKLKAREIPGDDGTITYSKDILDVTIEVMDGVDGEFEPDVTSVKKGSEELGGIRFTNEYSATGTMKLEGVKSVTGGRSADITADEFRFYVRDEGNHGNVIAKGTTVKGPVTGTAIAFEEISYTTVPKTATTSTYSHYGVKNGDVFRYMVGEYTSVEDSITIDHTVFEIQVTANVSDDGIINLTTEYHNGDQVKTDSQKSGKPLAFENKYSASGSIELKASKTLTGNRAEVLKKNEFEFELKDSGGVVISTAKNRADGTVVFPALNYTEQDIGKTYEYTVNEKTGTDPTITYSSKTFSIKVSVADGGEGKLIITPEYMPDAPVFENAYKAFGSIGLKAKKVLTGRSAALKENEFEFELKDSHGTVVGTAKNRADGTITFPSLNFTQDDIGKSYEYTMSEKKGTDSTITYSTQTYNVKVSVADGGSGKLNITEVYLSEEPVFENKYKASGSASLKAKKVLTGRSTALKDNEFEFELKDSHGTVVSTAKNLADGTIAFPALDYTQADIGKTYEYTLSEKKGTDSRITYSTETFTAKVSVADGGSGTLSITVEYLPEEPVFTNTYHSGTGGGGGGTGGGGGGGGGTPGTPTTPGPTLPTVPTNLVNPPAGPSGGNGSGLYTNMVYFTPQEKFRNLVLGASENRRNNLVLAAQNYRNNLVLGASASRVMTGDAASLGLYLLLLFASIATLGAAFVGRKRKDEED